MYLLKNIFVQNKNQILFVIFCLIRKKYENKKHFFIPENICIFKKLLK